MKINVSSMLKTLLFTIKNGKSISSGIQLLSNNAKRKKEKKIYNKINNDLKEGKTFSQALKTNNIGSLDIIHFISMAERGVSLKNTLEKIIHYLDIKEDFQRESSDKISLPFIYFSIATMVVIGIKFFAVPFEIGRSLEYGKKIIALISSHLELAETMANILFFSLVIAASYFIVLLLALFSEERVAQKIGKNIALKLPFTHKIVMKFEKFIIFSMIGEMLKSGISFKMAIQSAIETTDIKYIRKAFEDSLKSIKYEGKFIFHNRLFDGIEKDLLLGVGSTQEVGLVLVEISKRAREEALLLCTKFFRMIIFLSILLMTFAVFIEFYTVVLTQILIQKGLIDATRGVPL